MFLSESRRNLARTADLLVVVEGGPAGRAGGGGAPVLDPYDPAPVPTDLARMGWEVHAIATFAGHRSTDSTLRYIHLSGRDLAEKLKSSMTQIHAWRVHAHRPTAPADGTTG